MIAHAPVELRLIRYDNPVVRVFESQPITDLWPARDIVTFRYVKKYRLSINYFNMTYKDTNTRGAQEFFSCSSRAGHRKTPGFARKPNY